MAIEAFAPAKINLTLHVTGQRADGYHLLDSLVVFADVGDTLWMTAGPTIQIDVTGRFEAGVPRDDTNLVWRAAEAAGWAGQIKLEKNLPHGAGIGGGSADAAALLRALQGDDATQGIGIDGALALGADVPVCLCAGPQRMAGIGETLERVWPVPLLHLVLVNPGAHLSTPQVFQALETRRNPAMTRCDGWDNRSDFLDWLMGQRNDLQSAACRLAPDVAMALDALSGGLLARMTGSGATCFGIYEDKDAAQKAAAKIADDHPGWWVTSCTTAGQL